MQRWSSDAFLLPGGSIHELYLITQRCVAGWETFLANDNEGTHRFFTYSAKHSSMDLAAKFHQEKMKSLTSLQKVDSEVAAILSILYSQALIGFTYSPKHRIKIVKTPSGPESIPEEVRKAWVGIEIPLALDPSPWPIEYLVDPTEAIEILAKNDSRAAQWWKDSPDHGKADYLVFVPEWCELQEGRLLI